MGDDTMSWFRMHADAVDDEKLRLLAFEDRWHFFALLCCKCKGLLDSDDEQSMRARKIAVKLGVQVRELEEICRRLAEVGLIDASTWQPTAWDSRQYRSDTSAERTRKYRKRMKSKECDDGKRHSDVTVTPPDTETETETEATSTLARTQHLGDFPPPAVRASVLLRQRGCAHCHPGLPDLLAAVKAGATPEVIVDTYAEAEALGKSNPLAWALATARNRAADGVQGMSRGPPGRRTRMEPPTHAAYTGTPDDQLPPELRNTA